MLVFACNLTGLAQRPEVRFGADLALVRVDAQVLWRGEAIVNLTKDDFLIYENGAPRPILFFESEETPMDVVLLLDVSASMRPEAVTLAALADEVLGCLAATDRAALMVFAWRARLYQPLTADWRRVSDSVRQVIRREHFDGRTLLNAGAFGAATYLRHDPRKNARRAILMITDNLGWKARSDRAVLNELWEADAALNVVHLTDPSKETWRVRPLPFLGVAGMRKFVDETGGEWLNPRGKPNYLLEALTRIRRRYLLMYRAAPGRSGEERTIHVELSPPTRSRLPDAAVAARRGYRLREAIQ
jgi:VWFA-related protein